MKNTAFQTETISYQNCTRSSPSVYHHYFQPGIPLFYRSLTCAKKRCQRMPPSFGVKYPFAPKLFPNYNYFLQAVASKALHAVATMKPAFWLLRWGHLINMSGYPSSPFSLQPLALGPSSPPLKNSSAPPPANSGASSPNTRGFSQVLWMASISEIPQVQQPPYSPALLF